MHKREKSEISIQSNVKGHWEFFNHLKPVRLVNISTFCQPNALEVYITLTGIHTIKVITRLDGLQPNSSSYPQ